MEKVMNVFSKINLDKIGISLSGICAIHCLITPILLLMLPPLSGHSHNHEIHTFFFFFVAPVASFSFWRTYRAHGNIKPLILGGVGLLILLLPLVVMELHHTGHFISVVGSILMILAHLQSIRCKCHHSH